MTEPGDAKVAARYRALATQEPSLVLDDAIRAAARRSVASKPGGFRASRWAIPASVAAVLVLSFSVVLRMQQEQPGIESSLPAREAAPAKPAESPGSPPPPMPAAKPDAARTPTAVPAPAPVPEKRVLEKKVAPEPAASAPAAAVPASPPAPAAFPGIASPRENVASPRNEAGRMVAKERPAAPLAIQEAPVPRAKVEAAAGQADTAVMGRVAPETPEKALERIAELRRSGRDKEADEALVRFRREHPDYKIPAEVWERVRPK